MGARVPPSQLFNRPKTKSRLHGGDERKVKSANRLPWLAPRPGLQGHFLSRHRLTAFFLSAAPAVAEHRLRDRPAILHQPRPDRSRRGRGSKMREKPHAGGGRPRFARTKWLHEGGSGAGIPQPCLWLTWLPRYSARSQPGKRSLPLPPPPPRATAAATARETQGEQRRRRSQSAKTAAPLQSRESPLWHGGEGDGDDSPPGRRAGRSKTGLRGEGGGCAEVPLSSHPS